MKHHLPCFVTNRMKKFEMLQGLPKYDTETKRTSFVGKMALINACCRVATKLNFFFKQ